VLGGKRSGIRTILVRPIHRREFVGTRISRLFEGFLIAHFRRRGRLP
jgi:predicted HAD superfamily phosphohydrolase YqeG